MSGPPYQQVFGSVTVPPSQYQYQALSLGVNTAFNWPYNYSGTAAVTSTLIDMTATAAGLVFTMPPADAVSTGETVVFNNKGSNTFTIKDNAGNVLATVAAGVAQLLYVTNNLSAAGLWGQFTMGAGTSSATAGALAGLGLVAIGALLNAGYPVTTTAASTYAVHATLRAQVLDLNGGICTVTPDTAATLGNNFYFLLKNSGSGVATFSPSGGNTIDGNATMGFQPGESAIIVCSGSAFFTIGYGRSSVFQFSQLTLDISAGGTFTLTSAQASNKILSFVGNPAAGVVVVVPNVPAVYYVLSNLSTAQSITIKTAAGSGVVVPQSQRTILICDGVNVTVTQSPNISSGTSVSLPDGSNSSPSLNFSNETNTGFYRNGAGTIGVSVLGAEIAQFVATGMEVVDGAVGTPAYTFIGEPSSGFYRNGAGNLGVAILGAEVAEFEAGGLKLSAAAVASAFAPQVSQIQNGSLIWCGIATGTVNALVLTPSPAVTTNPAGQLFLFQASAAGNSGATTVAISGLTAIAVQKNGSALIGGEILANKLYGILVDTTATSCQLFPVSGWATSGQNNDIISTSALATMTNVEKINGQVPLFDNAVNDFRLTLISGTPVTTVDVTGAATLYCCPYKGTRLSLYISGVWQTRSSAQFSFSLSGLITNQPYDIFAYDNTGVPTLESLGWANSVVTMTLASPGVIAWTAHGNSVGDRVFLSTTGALYTGLTAGKIYVVNTVPDADHMTLKSFAEVVVNTSGTQSGVHTMYSQSRRATALVYQDGVLVKSGDATRRYLGSFIATSATTTEDSGNQAAASPKRYLWNYYNRIARSLVRKDPALSWIYNNTANRQGNANTANQLEVFIGVGEDVLPVDFAQSQSNSTASFSGPTGGIGINSTTILGQDVSSRGAGSAGGLAVLTASYRHIPPIGATSFMWIESSSTATATNTFYGSNLANPELQSGIYATIMG